MDALLRITVVLSKGMSIMHNQLTVTLFKRYFILLAGLTIMAFGVAFSIKASLGTSPISSVPYVISLFSPFTVGTATILMHSHALRFYTAPDFNSPKKISSDSADAASCSLSLWISH